MPLACKHCCRDPHPDFSSGTLPLIFLFPRSEFFESLPSLRGFSPSRRTIESAGAVIVFFLFIAEAYGSPWLSMMFCLQLPSLIASPPPLRHPIGPSTSLAGGGILTLLFPKCRSFLLSPTNWIGGNLPDLPFSISPSASRCFPDSLLC